MATAVGLIWFLRKDGKLGSIRKRNRETTGVGSFLSRGMYFRERKKERGPRGVFSGLTQYLSQSKARRGLAASSPLVTPDGAVVQRSQGRDWAAPAGESSFPQIVPLS